MKALEAVNRTISADAELRDVSLRTGRGRDLDHCIKFERTSM